MIRFIYILMMVGLFGFVQAAEPVFQDNVLSQTLANSITTFIHETENDFDLKLYLDNSHPHYPICVDGIDINNYALPGSFNFIIYRQSNKNVTSIDHKFAKYFRSGIYVIFPYQILSDNKITITITLKRLSFNSSDYSISESSIKYSQYVYTLCEDDLSWHLYQKDCYPPQ